MIRAVAAGLFLAAAPLAAQGQPGWSLGPGVADSLQRIWQLSLAERREQVACLSGAVAADTVRITLVLPLDVPATDSLTASAEESLAGCGPPQWIGTVHSHLRSTDSESPVNRFSPGDRAVMSAWRSRWGRRGAFCVVYSDRGMHCEVWPPPVGEAPRVPERR
jgi:hypothetical protein